MSNIVVVGLPGSFKRGFLGSLRGIGELLSFVVDLSGGLKHGSSSISSSFHSGEMGLGFTVSSSLVGLGLSSGLLEGIFGSVLCSSSRFGKIVSIGDFASDLFLLGDGITRGLVSVAFGFLGLRVI